MKIEIKAKASLYKSFPEFKNKDITFLEVKRDNNYGGDYAVYVKIGDDFIGEMSADYFKLTIKF